MHGGTMYVVAVLWHLSPVLALESSPSTTTKAVLKSVDSVHRVLLHELALCEHV